MLLATWGFSGAIGRQWCVLMSALRNEIRRLADPLCSFFSDIFIQYPQFFGHSYVTFEPLKNSYQAFQVTLEFRVRTAGHLNGRLHQRKNGKRESKTPTWT